VRTLRKTLAVLGAGLAGAVLLAMPALAVPTISSPSNGFNVPGDGSGNATVPFDVSVSGYGASQNVFIELCDGKPSSTPGWSPGLDCDNGTSPAAGITDANGNFTFHANDPNHQFPPPTVDLKHPPTGAFECFAPGESQPNDGLPHWTNCQLRSSTNNGAATTDQAFITLTMPAASAQTPEVPLPIVLPVGAILIGGAFFVIKKRQDARSAAVKA
jgi:hypothetical protein